MSVDRVAGSDVVEEGMKSEYKILRKEIDRRSTVQQALLVLNLTAVGAITSSALKSGASEQRAFYEALLIPYISFALARLWLDHHNAIAKLGSHIRRTIEARTGASWETGQHARYRNLTTGGHYLFFAAYGIVFVGPSVAALVGTLHLLDGTAREVAWWSAVLASGLNVYGWIEACWPRRERATTLERVRMIFEPRVRTQLAWERLAAQPYVSVREFYVDQSTDFRGWFFPWYVNGDVEVEHTDAAGSAIAVVDCGKLPPGRAKEVEKFLDWVSEVPRVFDLCTYNVGSDTVVVLDGNHRLAAGLRSGGTFWARVFEITGPVDSSILPDLERVARGQPS